MVSSGLTGNVLTAPAHNDCSSTHTEEEEHVSFRSRRCFLQEKLNEKRLFEQHEQMTRCLLDRTELCAAGPETDLSDVKLLLLDDWMMCLCNV